MIESAHQELTNKNLSSDLSSSITNLSLEALTVPVLEALAPKATSLSSFSKEVILKCIERRSRGTGFSTYLAPSVRDLTPFKLLESGEDFVRVLLQRTLLERVPTVIFHDYDVDGTTSCAQIIHTLRAFRLSSIIMREGFRRFSSGYSISQEMIDRAFAAGAKLFVILDAGTKLHDAIRQIKSRGGAVIVLDHHEIGDLIHAPPADVFVNPMKANCGFNGKGYCTSGLAYRACMRLLEIVETRDGLGFSEHALLDAKLPQISRGYLAFLSSLGAIQDMMPMLGDNRVIESLGAQFYNQTRYHPVVNAFKSGTNSPIFSSELVAFKIGPAINSAGRVRDDGANVVVDLLLSERKSEAGLLEKELRNTNLERKKYSRSITLKLVELLKSQHRDPYVNVYAGLDFHSGAIGPAASWLIPIVKTPVFVLGELDSQTLTGSARSVNDPRIDLSMALESEQVRRCLLSGGGHKMAAGIKILKSELENFKVAISKEISRQTEGTAPELTFGYDLEMSITDMRLIPPAEWSLILDILHPFGNMNRPPTIRSHGRVSIIKGVNELRPYSKKIVIVDGSSSISAVGWSMPDSCVGGSPQVGDLIEFTAEVGIDHNKSPYNQRAWQPQLTILGFKVIKS